MSTVGQKIARRRALLGLSQLDLVALVKPEWPTCNRSEISKIENDERPQFSEAVERLGALAKALQIPVDDLVGEE